MTKADRDFVVDVLLRGSLLGLTGALFVFGFYVWFVLHDAALAWILAAGSLLFGAAYVMTRPTE